MTMVPIGSLIFLSPLSFACLSLLKQLEFHFPLARFVLCGISQLSLRAHPLCKSGGCKHPCINIPDNSTRTSFQPQATPLSLQELPSEKQEMRLMPWRACCIYIHQGSSKGLTILQFPTLSAPMSWHHSLPKEMRHSLQKWQS